MLLWRDLTSYWESSLLQDDERLLNLSRVKTELRHTPAPDKSGYQEKQAHATIVDQPFIKPSDIYCLISRELLIE